MKITDIPQTTEITIKVVHNGVNKDCKTTVLTTYADGLLVTPIMCEGRMVEYCAGGTIEYEKPGTGVNHHFQLESITKTDFDGTCFHVIRGKEVAVIDKKRKAERYMVQRMGVAVVNGRKTINVIVNDISMRGLSLLVGKDQYYKVGDELAVSFFTGGVAQRLKLRCKVVRLFQIGGYNAVGCTVKNIDMDYLNFVSEKKAEYNKKANVKLAV